MAGIPNVSKACARARDALAAPPAAAPAAAAAVPPPPFKWPAPCSPHRLLHGTGTRSDTPRWRGRGCWRASSRPSPARWRSCARPRSCGWTVRYSRVAQSAAGRPPASCAQLPSPAAAPADHSCCPQRLPGCPAPSTPRHDTGAICSGRRGHRGHRAGTGAPAARHPCLTGPRGGGHPTGMPAAQAPFELLN